MTKSYKFMKNVALSFDFCTSSMPLNAHTRAQTQLKEPPVNDPHKKKENTHLPLTDCLFTPKTSQAEH